MEKGEIGWGWGDGGIERRRGGKGGVRTGGDGKGV